MDTITISWLKIASLLAIAGIIIGILAWAVKCFKAAIKDIKEAAQLEIQAYELKENKPKDDGYSNKDLFPKQKTTAFKDYRPGGHYIDCKGDTCKCDTCNPSPKPKTWVAEIILPKGENKTPCYYFHCPAYDGKPGSYQGKCYLYTPTGNGFVTTENPTTAILLQQLLNDGQLTVKPFTTETNELSK